jgi:hypothetical protein
MHIPSLWHARISQNHISSGIAFVMLGKLIQAELRLARRLSYQYECYCHNE